MANPGLDNRIWGRMKQRIYPKSDPHHACPLPTQPGMKKSQERMDLTSKRQTTKKI